MFLWLPSTKFVQTVVIRQKKKKMAVSGVGLYSDIKHFKNLFIRNHWTNFKITWQKCSFGDLLSRSRIKSSHDVLKRKSMAWCVGGGGGGWGGGRGGGGQGYKIYT